METVAEDRAALIAEVAALRSDLDAALLAAKNATVSKEMFLARMNHELRTPLNAILGFSELLAGQVYGPLGSPQYIDYVNDIHQSGERLASSLTDILDMAKIDAGKVELVEEDVDPTSLINSVLQLVRADAEKAGLRIDAEIADTPTILGDERALRRAILNMLSNAIKFTPAGGHIRLALRLDASAGLLISVTDTGIGMDMAEVPRLLQPFAQGAEDFSRAYEGGGLGLPVTKALLELHDGALDIRSKVGVGTTVTLSLPAYRLNGHQTQDATMMDFGSDITTANFEERLVLEYEGTAVNVFEGSGNCLLGRNREKPNEVRCDIVVDDKRVSRPHARVRHESDGFYLVDVSQRGTHIVMAGARTFARQDAPIRLQGQGEIYLGVEPGCVDLKPVRFHLSTGMGA